MIRHHPFGIGRPYRFEPDQRVPPRPVAGEPIELRATTHISLLALAVEVEVDGVLARRDLAPYDPAKGSRPASSGHLALVTRRLTGRGRKFWQVSLDAQPVGTRLRYRFVAANGACSRVFEVNRTTWPT